MTAKTVIKAAAAVAILMAVVFVTSGSASMAIAGDKEVVFGKREVAVDKLGGFERPDIRLNPFLFRERNPFLFEEPDLFLFDEENVFGFRREEAD